MNLLNLFGTKKLFFDRKLRKGLTLIEILIVLVIIIILVLIMLFFWRKQLFKSNDAKRKSDIEMLTVAIEEYEKDHNCYPHPTTVNLDCKPGDGLSDYIAKIPCDPVTGASYYYDYDLSSTCPKWFRLSAKLEDESDSAAQDYCGPSGSFNYYQSSPNAPSCEFTQPSGNFYGCKSGVCVPLLWDNSRPGVECEPFYRRSDCFGACGSSSCTPWQ